MILIINGPNINMLGKRNKEIYGSDSYESLKNNINEWSTKNNIKVEIFQSNSEGKIIDRLQNENYSSLIINAGAYTHYSYAIRDALEIINIPKIEIHISNIFKREDFRKKTIIGEMCDYHLSGFGIYGYIIALNYLLNDIERK